MDAKHTWSKQEASCACFVFFKNTGPTTERNRLRVKWAIPVEASTLAGKSPQLPERLHKPAQRQRWRTDLRQILTQALPSPSISG